MAGDTPHCASHTPLGTGEWVARLAHARNPWHDTCAALRSGAVQVSGVGLGACMACAERELSYPAMCYNRAVDMTHVYLIRHAQQFSAHNDQGLLLADHEDGLTEKGHAQARRMAERIVNDIQPDVLYCSPLLRARQTARHVGDATGLPLNIDPNLAELRLNCPSEVPTSVEFDGWVRARRYPYTPAFPGGEALADLQRRGMQAFEQITQTHWGKSIVVITHGGLIEMVFFHLLGVPIERNLVSFVHCDHTGLFHWRWLELKDLNINGWDLLTSNDTHHLDGL